MNLRNILTCLVPLALFAHCQPPAAPLRPDDSEFFPLETGRYVLYDVTEQRYSLTGPPVSQTYQVKEVVGAAYRDVTGQPAFRLQRFRRTDDRSAWQPDSVWAIRRTDSRGIRTENGVDYVSLVFPADDRSRWNGNGLNSRGEDTYELRNSRRPFRVLDTLFDETVTVVQQTDSTLVAQDKRIDVFARRVGLVYREKVWLQYCTSSPGCVGRATIDFGYRQIYRARTYGND